jgi:hypothetical protein
VVLLDPETVRRVAGCSVAVALNGESVGPHLEVVDVLLGDAGVVGIPSMQWSLRRMKSAPT